MHPWEKGPANLKSEGTHELLNDNVETVTNYKFKEFLGEIEAYMHSAFVPREQFPYIFKQKHRRPLVKDYKETTTRIRLQLSQDIMWK